MSDLRPDDLWTAITAERRARLSRMLQLPGCPDVLLETFARNYLAAVRRGALRAILAWSWYALRMWWVSLRIDIWAWWSDGTGRTWIDGDGLRHRRGCRGGCEQSCMGPP